MKKRILASLMVVILVISLLGSAAFAQTDMDLNQVDGKLMITEAGSYVLQGKLAGCVCVDPGAGDVELILDGVDIDGRTGAGIVALSGNRLTLTIPEGSVNRVVDGGSDALFDAAIYSRIDTVFEGAGALYVTGNNQNGIQAERANLTFNGGSYAIKAPENGLGANTLTFNDGHFSIQAANNIDPSAGVVINGSNIGEYMPVSSAPAVVAEVSSDIAQTWVPAFITNLFNDQQAPVVTDGNTNGQQSQMPDGAFNGQQPQMPDGNNNAQQPQMPDGNTNGQQPQMPDGGFNGQQPQMPDGNTNGQQTNVSSAASPSEVVAGTMTNSAASLEADYDNATYITVTDDDSQVKITSSGTYVVTGSSSDGNITVKKGTTGVVLVLDDLDLTSTTGATVSINKEAEVKVIISGTVTLTDNENPDDENSDDADVADAFDGAAFKAKANSNVYVTGDGTLIINGNAKNGIKAGDDSSLIFDGVTVNINAVNDGINGNYDVTLLSGNFTIAAGDDAIHADHILTVGNTDGTGPTIRVTGSNEGMEGTVVNIYGGDISIVSSDDAINAANGDGLYEGVLDYSFNMMGGNLVINSQGDGIDSNGNVNLIGGNAQIHSASNGGEAGIDYDGQYYISDDFQLNNQSGMAGPDGMPGQMGGMPGQMGGMPGEMGGQQPGQMGGQQSGNMGGGFGGQQPGGFGGQMSGGNPPSRP